MSDFEPLLMQEPGTKRRGLLAVAIRARRYQVGCILLVLFILIGQFSSGLHNLVATFTKGEIPHNLPISFGEIKPNSVSWTSAQNQDSMVENGSRATKLQPQIPVSRTSMPDEVVIETDLQIFSSTKLPKRSANPANTLPVVPGKKFGITACAMVQNEAAYLVEWIEFHRLQGVDHFVIYSYYSTDLLEYIPMIYEDAGFVGVVEVIPARFLTEQGRRNLEQKTDYEKNKEWSRADCTVRYGKYSQWLLHLDAGQFVYSKVYSNIIDFLVQETEIQRKTFVPGDEGQDGVFSAVQISPIRFGTSGIQRKFLTWLTPNAYSGSADLLFEPYRDDSSNLYPLVIESNLRRAPHATLDTGVTEKCVESAELCKEPSSIILVKGDRCPATDVEECLRPTWSVSRPEWESLRADDHNWRAVNQVLGAPHWDESQSETFKAMDGNWFFNVRDEEKSRFIEPVRRAIEKLKPRAFYAVDRACQEEALTMKQQVMCPSTHPYAFGNFGMKWLHQCCKTDKDSSGNPLKAGSNSCYGNAAVDCPEAQGVEKWLHRTCCNYIETR